MRLLAAFVATLTMLGSAAVASAATVPVAGSVSFVDAAASGITIGDRITGTVSYDEAGTSPYAVTDLALALPGGIALSFANEIFSTVTAGAPMTVDFYLDAGNVYGFSGVSLVSGSQTFPLDAKSFQLFDLNGSIVASGALAVTPIPAALPLLGSAVLGMGLLVRARRNRA